MKKLLNYLKNIGFIALLVIGFIILCKLISLTFDSTPKTKVVKTQTLDSITPDSAKKAEFLAYITYFEGGVSRDPYDLNAYNLPPFLNGGHTSRGVSWWSFCHVFKPKIKCLQDYETLRLRFHGKEDKGLSDEDFYKVWETMYFKDLKLDSIKDKRIAYAVSDFCWASGTQGIIKLQQALGSIGYPVYVDGRISTQTISTINKLKDLESKRLLDSYFYIRKGYYTGTPYGIALNQRVDSLYRLLVK